MSFGILDKVVITMTKIVKTFNLPNALVDMAKQHFNTTNVSKTITSCLTFTFLNNFSALSKDSLERYHFLKDVAERRNTTSYSVRVNMDILNAICTQSDKCASEAVIDAMVHTLSYNRTSSQEVNTPAKIINILGSKWDNRMQSAIKNIHDTANINWQLSIETCVGALGIHANFHFADTEIINDDDIEKINLYNIIKNNPVEFKVEALKFECTEESFIKLKESVSSNEELSDIKRAVRFFLLNYFSKRNSGHTFNNKSKQNLIKRLDNIGALSKRLNDVQIKNNDIFDIIKKYKYKTDIIFIVDPIYLDTNVYKSRKICSTTEHKKEFGWNEHQRLAKELRSIKGDFIYFCRITATRHKNKKGILKDSQDDIQRKDIEMLGRIDDLYWGYGFYYIDVELDNGTIERIITSFDFNGATQYAHTNESEVQ